MTLDIKRFVIDHAHKALCEQAEDGSMPPGCNGPYGHPELPLRNTAHWLVLWAFCFKWTGEKDFINAANKALSYVLLPENRPQGFNWYQRNQRGRDQCNGTIGVAWIIETLCHATAILGSKRAAKIAFEVYEQHRFDSKNSLWNRLEVDGQILSIDQTFNHQLWLAASASRLAQLGSKLAKSDVSRFLDNIDTHFEIYRNGLIQHRISLKWYDRLFRPGTPFHFAYLQYDKLKKRSFKSLDVKKRDHGYHAFNMHAFSTLKRNFPNHSFWENEKFLKALDYARSEKHGQNVSPPNPYSYEYNPVGFEMAYTISVFDPKSKQEANRWLQRQIGELGPDYGLQACDSNTAKARVYEVVEYVDLYE
ncbi:hypothetical protein [Pelagicoccus albus]|uniref:Agl cluster protein AglQ n=1 Tax=Pelagicoccus albus TaxID=415222 RepID=A0A7X1B551_9BACT|nr:hypothetical protein [Pelagicoccus albus]MBC2605828.1 hypothetical protein [Pelagicoccus albus]